MSSSEAGFCLLLSQVVRTKCDSQKLGDTSEGVLRYAVQFVVVTYLWSGAWILDALHFVVDIGRSILYNCNMGRRDLSMEMHSGF